MINKLRDEWEKLSQEAKSAAAEDPARHQAIVERMNAVAAALKKMSQGSVTRTTLSQAVRDSLREILKSESVLPEVQTLREEVSGLERKVEEGLAGVAGRSGEAEAKLKDGLDAVSAGFEKIDGRLDALERAAPSMGGLEDLVARKLADFEERHAAENRELKGFFERELAAFRASLAERTAGEEAGAASKKELREKVESIALDFQGRAADLARRIGEQSDRIQTLSQDLFSADDHLAEGLKDLESRLSGRVAALEALTASRFETLEGNLRHSIAAAETRLSEAQGQMETRISGEVRDNVEGIQLKISERLVKLEEALPQVEALEERLKSQMEIAMNQIADKVNFLIARVEEIRSIVPTRDLVEGLQDRLDGLEARSGAVSERLDFLGGAVPELKVLGEMLAGLRSELEDLKGEMARSGKEISGNWEAILHRSQDTQDLLRAFIESRDSDRATFHQRLVGLRDILRDQLLNAVKCSDGMTTTFWSKLFSKPEGGLHFGAEEWDRFRRHVENVIQGIEAIISDTK